MTLKKLTLSVLFLLCVLYGFKNINGTSNNNHIDAQLSRVALAAANNLTIDYICGYTADSIINLTADCSGKTSSCSPVNFTDGGNACARYIQNVTNQGQYNASVQVEDGNEYDNQQFSLTNLSTSNTTKFLYYNALHNETIKAVHALYPNMTVTHFGFGSVNTTDQQTFFKSIAGNYTANTTNTPFHDYFPYLTLPHMDDEVLQIASAIKANCALFSAPCTLFDLNEFGTLNKTMQVNDTQRYALELTLAKLALVTNYPGNSSAGFYQLQTGDNQNDSAQFQGGNPDMVAEPGLCNATGGCYYTPYNVTQDFGNSFLPGNIVVNATTTDTGIAIAASMNSTTQSLLIANKNTTAKNVSLSVTGVQRPSVLQDKATRTNYTYNITSSQFDNVPMGNQSVNYYTLFNDTTPPTTTYLLTAVGTQNASVSVNLSEPGNLTVQWGNTTALLSGTASNATYARVFSLFFGNLTPGIVYANVTMSNQFGNANTTQINFTVPTDFAATILTPQLGNNLSSFTLYTPENLNASYPFLLYPNGTQLQLLNYTTTGVNGTFSATVNITASNTTLYISPLTISGSSNVISISSNLTFNYTNVTLNLSTNGIVPSSPSLTFPDGSSVSRKASLPANWPS